MFTKIRDIENPPGIEGVRVQTLYACAAGEHPFVVVSAIRHSLAHETYIFPANAAGEVTDWGELPGSYRGGMSHEEALDGYRSYVRRIDKCIQ